MTGGPTTGRRRPIGESPDIHREAADLLAATLQRRVGFVPEWTALPGDAGRAVLETYAAMTELLWERLDRAGDKNKLAFLNSLGIDSLPPAPAQAPVAFEPLPGSVNGAVAAGSLVAATAEEGTELTYRTSDAIGLTSSGLAEVHSVVPERDTIGDHSAPVMGGRPVRLFENQVPTGRYLYIGHDDLLAVRGEASIAIELELGQEASVPLTLQWSIWNGDLWRQIDESDVIDLTVTAFDGVDGSLGRSGTVTLTTQCIEAAPTEVDGVDSYWLRCHLTTPLGGIGALELPTIDQLRLAVTLGDPTEPVIYPVESAVALGQPVDVTSPYYPFGQAPDRTTIFYFDAGQLVTSGLRAASIRGRVEVPGPSVIAPPELEFEYWDGARWSELRAPHDLGLTPANNGASFDLAFTVPLGWSESEHGGAPGRWGRLRLPEGGSYIGKQTVDVPIIVDTGTDSDGDGIDDLATETATITVEVPSPPLLSNLELTVSGTTPATPADHVFVFNRDLFDDQTSSARWRGSPFTPFHPNPDRTPAVYLGFDGPIAVGNLGLFIDVDPTTEDYDHEFRWERLEGDRWLSLPVDDETDHLTATGIVRLLWPGNPLRRRVDPVVAEGDRATAARSEQANTFAAGEQVHVTEGEKGELARVARIEGSAIVFTKDLADSYQLGSVAEPEAPLFGRPRTWIRARLTESASPPSLTLNRIVPNAAWVSEQRTIEKELLGSGDGQPNQRARATQTPVLPGERLQVRELQGAQARTDLAILERELAAIGRSDAIEVTDNAAGDPDEVWVTWEPRPNLLTSGPNDRHYVINRVTGTFACGDDEHGRSFPTGVQNLRGSYTSGGGSAGNVAAGEITTPLSGVVVAGVSNLRAASGGADAESDERARVRAAGVVGHRFQAVTAADIRGVALEASPEVYDAAVVVDPDDLGGRLRLIVVPDSVAVPPTPSPQLLHRVAEHVALRCPAGSARHLSTVAPHFVPIGVEATIAGEGNDAELFDRVRSNIEQFLHPVTGGVTGEGWPLATTVHVSRFANLIETIDGVDYTESFTITARGAIVGDAFVLAADELPTVGVVRIRLTREAVR